MTSYLKKDILVDIPDCIKNTSLFDEWYFITKDILISEEFQKRKLFPHHHNMSVWDHSILVSFNSFIASKYLNADTYICSVAGLLHDFYPWSWIYSDDLETLDNGFYLEYRRNKHPFLRQHGFIHGKAAAENYVKYYPELENKKITNAIKYHMFPLTIIPPISREGIIITMVDKINSVRELPNVYDLKISIKNKIYRKVRNVDTK